MHLRSNPGAQNTKINDKNISLNGMEYNNQLFSKSELSSQLNQKLHPLTDWASPLLTHIQKLQSLPRLDGTLFHSHYMGNKDVKQNLF
jgi:hypothetical protein